MKQILLVDDDFLSLNAFYSLVHWENLGVRIAYEAHNGREAITFLENCTLLPDAAFLDVCMPDMDGIALLQTLRVQYPSIQCFMLSSYSDYPYVRETLKLGAADYLLKHEMTAQSITRLLEAHGLARKDLEPADTPDQKLQRVLSGETDEALCGVLLCAFYQDERPLLDPQRASIAQTCRHLLNDLPGVAIYSSGAGSLAFFLPHADASDSAQPLGVLSQRAALMQKALVKYHNVHYAFTPPRFLTDSAQIAGAYTLLSQEYNRQKRPQAVLSARESALLTLAVANGSKPLLCQTLHTLFEESAAPFAELCNHLLALLAHIRQTQELPAVPPAPIPGSAAQAEAYVVGQFCALCDQTSDLLHRRYSIAIRDALDYLKHHYAEEIHLSDVARHCHLSYTHLSYAFKKETGDNIISCLTRIRVYHAAYALLFDDRCSISDACQQTGFKGYNHFVATFKNVTGMTPSEFRKSPSAIDWLLGFAPSGLSV